MRVKIWVKEHNKLNITGVRTFSSTRCLKADPISTTAFATDSTTIGLSPALTIGVGLASAIFGLICVRDKINGLTEAHRILTTRAGIPESLQFSRRWYEN